MRPTPALIIALVSMLSACGVHVTDYRGANGVVPTISDFSAVTAIITAGDTTQLHAVFAGGTGVIDHGVGSVTSGQDVVITPEGDGALSQTAYTLTVTGGTTAAQTVVLQVAAPPVLPTIVTATSVAAHTHQIPASVAAAAGLTYHWAIVNGTLDADVGSTITFTSADSGDLVLAVQATNAAGATVTASTALRVSGIAVLAGALGVDGDKDGDAASASMRHPQGVAAAADGRIVVADTLNHTLRRWDPTSTLMSTIAGSAGVSGTDNGASADARFNQPRGLAFDNSGTLYIADYGNDAVRTLGADGTVSTVTTSLPIYEPNAVAVDETGRIFVACADAKGAGGHGQIIAIDHGMATVVGSGFAYAGDTSSGGFGIASTHDGSVLLVATSQHVRQLTRTGSVYVKTTIAGAPSIGNPPDGALALEANLGSVFAVAFDEEGLPLILNLLAIFRLQADAHLRTLYAAPGQPLLFSSMAVAGGDIFATSFIPTGESRLLRVRLP